MTETAKKPRMAAVKSLTEDRDNRIIEVLEGFIQLAKDGHISDLAVIGKVRGAPITEFEWDGDAPLDLLGALELAKMEVSSQLLAEIDGDVDDGEED